MSINLVKTTSTNNTTYRANRKIEYIVIHYTAGVTSKSGSANNTAKYFSTSKVQASADFIVDDVYCVQYNPDIKNRYCWHCGDGKAGVFGGKCYNNNSIGIEVCSSNTTGKITSACDQNFYFTDAAIDNAIELTKSLMATYGIKSDHVIRHYDVSKKLCPGVRGWIDNSFGNAKWQSFKSALVSKQPAVTTATKVKTNASSNVVASAKGKLDSFRGSYTVTASALNMRYGPSTSYTVRRVLNNGDKVTCYGYYTETDGVKWLLVVTAEGYTGYCSSVYLKKL